MAKENRNAPGIDCVKLHRLMESVINKAKEVQAECMKQQPEVWRLCDLAVEDLEGLFDEVNACVSARSIDIMKRNRRYVAEIKVGIENKMVNRRSKK